MSEKLDFRESTPYDAMEASIHLNRYSMVKSVCEGKRVLDAACGEGYGSYFLKKWGAKEVYGLDIDVEAVKKADHIFGSSDVKFQCHTVEELPFPDYYFDMIVSFETIEHIDRPEDFLKEVHRVLKPGGMIILSCPNDPYYYKEGNISNPFHKKAYNFFEFKELAEQYLGNDVDYYFGTAVNGFLNMPVSKATEPSEARTDNMLEMLNYVECGSALCVRQDQYLNQWNCNYYVGIWGGNERHTGITTVIHPREFFAKLDDRDIECIKQIQKWKEQQKNQDIELKERYDVEILKVERLSAMNELLNKEIGCLRKGFDKKTQEIQKCQEEIDKILQKKRELEVEKSYIDGELAGIKKSKGWKLLMFLYKVEGIFRK